MKLLKNTIRTELVQSGREQLNGTGTIKPALKLLVKLKELPTISDLEIMERELILKTQLQK